MDIATILIIISVFFVHILVFSINLTGKYWPDLILDFIFGIGIVLLSDRLVGYWKLEVSLIHLGCSFLLGLIYYIFINRNNVDLLSGKGKYNFVLEVQKGKNIYFTDPFDNWLVYAGANSGKTKSIGKPLLREYIKAGFAGFIYDYKDFDYTKSAYNFCRKYNYPNKFYYISFTDVSRSYRFNPIKPSVLTNENLLIQLMDDILSSFMKKKEEDIWFLSALGLLKGVAYRFYRDFPHLCTIPHITLFILHSEPERMSEFLVGNLQSKALAKAFLDSSESEKTQASILTTLSAYLSNLGFNKEIIYVLSGDDFEFNLLDPEDPKLVAVSNSFSIENSIAPIMSVLINVSSRSFKFGNKVPFVYFLDEATTFKVNDFEKLPSVLREYMASFTFITQSGSKIEKLYSKLDKSSIESNFSNLLVGRTKDTEALKNYAFLFGKEDKKKFTQTKGSSSNSENKSISISTQKEERYEGAFFKDLKAGEFIGSAAHSNYKDFHLQFKQFDPGYEEELPIVRAVIKRDVEKNYDKIVGDVLSLKF